MAGRTASAFTAQLGAMKGNEEIDALRMTGLDPVVLLVLPRIIALLIALPLLTFIGMVCGILGACWCAPCRWIFRRPCSCRFSSATYKSAILCSVWSRPRSLLT
ncbi:ABC transporter permease [Neopusillimonas aromaticivorans]|nr:ABC transporter permease [Neopusillimonas aromaticivorans]WJJ93641.1 ABC transporter permease [Neopusillimonas aromaticivorans]